MQIVLLLVLSLSRGARLLDSRSDGDVASTEVHPSLQSGQPQEPGSSGTVPVCDTGTPATCASVGESGEEDQSSEAVSNPSSVLGVTPALSVVTSLVEVQHFDPTLVTLWEKGEDSKPGRTGYSVNGAGVLMPTHKCTYIITKQSR